MWTVPHNWSLEGITAVEPQDRFISPTRGPMSMDEMFDDIITYMHSVPDAKYKLIIGSDSHARDDSCFVTAVIIHRLGKGARYYYQRQWHRKITSLRQKIFYETSLSLTVASDLADRLTLNGHHELDLEIHLDIGQAGRSRDLIRELVGMVVGSGFDARIKPDSYGAFTVADKHTK